MTNAATLTESQLRQFTGSENWYRHGINRSVLYTDGAQFLAEQGGAYCLGYHLKTGHTLSVQNRPTGLA